MFVHLSTLNCQICISWVRPKSSARAHDLTNTKMRMRERKRERKRESARARARLRENQRETASASVCLRFDEGTTFQMSKHASKS